MNNSTSPTGGQDPAMHDFLGLVAAYAMASNRRDQLQAQVDAVQLTLVDTHRITYGELELSLQLLRDKIEALAREHPEWFAEKKGFRTPAGTVKLTNASKLVVADEQETLRRIATLLPEEEARRLVRQRLELDREALENFTDESLADLGIQRLEHQSFSIVPAKVELGKAPGRATQARTKAAAAAAQPTEVPV